MCSERYIFWSSELESSLLLLLPGFAFQEVRPVAVRPETPPTQARRRVGASFVLGARCARRGRSGWGLHGLHGGAVACSADLKWKWLFLPVLAAKATRHGAARATRATPRESTRVAATLLRTQTWTAPAEKLFRRFPLRFG